MYPPQTAVKSLAGPDGLGLGLLAICLYAAFAQGAIRAPEEPRLQVGVAVIAILTAVVGAARGAPSRRPPRTALAGLGLLVAFLAWSALTLAWSTDPNGTWIEVNRLVTDAIVLILALLYGAHSPRPLQRARDGLVLLSGAVCLDALGQKIAPGLHVAGLLDLNQTGTLARLQAPLGYWNALALLLVLGAPAALSLLLSGTATARRRAAGLVLLELIVVTVAFTESRGGFLALAVALGAMVACSPDRLGALALALLGLLGGVAGASLGLVTHPLSANGVPLEAREEAGALFTVVLIAIATLSVIVLPTLERACGGLSSRRRRGIWRLIGYGSLLLVAVAVVGATVSHRGLAGQISHLWSGFNHADSVANSGAGRLLSDSSTNRVAWWGQAVAGFLARPLGGWGAGSFPVVNLLFRHDTIAVQDAHSVPLQWLSDTGAVGALLALGAWAALIRAGALAVRRAGAGRIDPLARDTPGAATRLAAGALFAAAVAASVHGLYDWDADIPGVALPTLAILGVLGGSLAGAPEGAAAPASQIVPPPVQLGRVLSPGTRLLPLAAAVALLGLFAVSAVLPGLAANRAAASLATAAHGTPAALSRAAREAALAAVLDPLSGAGPLARAQVARAEGSATLARDFTLQAIAREPTDLAAWRGLLSVDLGLGRGAEALLAARRILTLDPEMGVVGFLTLAQQVDRAELAITPPAESAAAIATP